MKKISLAFVFLLFSSANLFAGKATITGSAWVSRAPEFVEVNLSVKSECYARPLEAMTANNSAVVAVQTFLREHVDMQSEIDGIFTDGGLTSHFSRMVYRGGESHVLCANTFQQITNVKFRTGNVKDFARLFASIQENVLQNFSANSEGSEQAITFINIDTPSADVCDETRREMAKEAKKLAASDAIEQFRNYASACGIEGPAEIKDFSEVGPGHQGGNFYKGALPDADAHVVFGFQNVKESAQVTVIVEFPTTILFCRDPLAIPMLTRV